MKKQLDDFAQAYAGNVIYDFDNQILLNWYPKRIVQLIGKAGSLLELGLGHGFSSQVFREHCDKYTILEGSPSVIANFNQHHPGFSARIIEAMFEEFDTDERFDVIVMGFVLEHVDSPVEIMARYRRFLAPSGRMFVAVPNAEAMNRRLGHLAGFLPDLFQLSDNDRALGHQRLYSVGSLKRDVAEAGGRVVRMEGIYLKPLTTGQLLSLKMDESVFGAMCELGIQYPDLSCGLLAEVAF